MKAKVKQLKVANVIETGHFRVVQAVDTIDHLPGSTVHCDRIAKYCGDPSWKITVIHPSKE